jgi:hypothetical protein
MTAACRARLGVPTRRNDVGLQKARRLDCHDCVESAKCSDFPPCCRVCRRRFALVISRLGLKGAVDQLVTKITKYAPRKEFDETHANPSGEEHLAECDRPAARRICAVERATRSEVPVANGGFPPVLDQSTMATPPVTVKEVVSVRDRARRPEFSEETKMAPRSRARGLVTDPTRPSRPPNSSRAPASTHNASPSPTSRWRARSSSASARRARRTPSSSLTWRTRRSR